jgi:hypothetical protein
VNLKSKALHIDRKDFEIKINESKKHYSKLIYDEIRKGKEISWHINETFEFDIIQTVDKLDSNNKYYQLDCKFCEVTISANDLDHNFQNYFKFHCQRAGHKLKIENDNETTKRLEENRAINYSNLTAKYSETFYFLDKVTDEVVCVQCSNKSRSVMALVTYNEKTFISLINDHVDSRWHKDNSNTQAKQTSLNQYFLSTTTSSGSSIQGQEQKNAK